MITAAVVVPQTPLLLPGVAVGVPEVEVVRSAAAGAVAWLIDTDCDHIVVVSGADTTAVRTAAGSPAAGYLGGVTAPGALPLGLAVGSALLGDAARPVVLQSVAHDAAPAAARALGAGLARGERRTALLVVGDGSACRHEKAPGHLDPRAATFDAVVTQAFATGDVAALAGVDASVAAELHVAGRSAWQVLAGAVRDHRVSAMIDYRNDPFGVWYLVARWALVDPRAGGHQANSPAFSATH